MTRQDQHAIKGDRALASGDEDKLGFRDVAQRIAISLVDRASSDGLVVGIEGAWGSGKSSLLSLIGDELEKLPEARRPTVIDFRPWLIGDRDALIAALFEEMSQQLARLELAAGDATADTLVKAKRATKALRKFAKALGHTGSVLEVAGEASGIGWLKWFGKGAKATGEWADRQPEAPQLVELKDQLAGSLRDLNHRFIIKIDDVDRLEPAEVIEILRLVRSVVDLPNMIYLLCYDSGILAHSIEQAAKVEDGHAYLEKIVQLTVMVPNPEPMQLRQWFSDKLQELASVKDEDERSRLQQIIDYEGGRQLRTPRSVVRALDSIRFFWPPLNEVGADLPDLVWVQLIKDGNAALYRWIEDYCATAAVVSLGSARVSNAEKAKQLTELFATVSDDYFDDELYRYYFADQLPGIEVEFAAGEKKLKIFQPVSVQNRDQAIRSKRLGSPDHYRIYFALTGPSHALTQDDFSAIGTAANESDDAAGRALLALHEQTAVGSLTKADLLLERLRSGESALLTAEQCGNLLLAFAQVLDEAFRRRPFDQNWVNSFWDRARRLIPSLLSRLDPLRRAQVIGSMFGSGNAIGWLTSLLRHETFAHGRYGDRRSREGEWLFSDEELDRICELLLGRYRAMSITDVFATPDPLSLLFAWRQAGDEEGPRRLVEGSISSNENLINALEHLTSPGSSSARGRYVALKPNNIGPFLDFAEARQRIADLTSDIELGPRARKLAAAFDDGDGN